MDDRPELSGWKRQHPSVKEGCRGITVGDRGQEKDLRFERGRFVMSRRPGEVRSAPNRVATEVVFTRSWGKESGSLRLSPLRGPVGGNQHREHVSPNALAMPIRFHRVAAAGHALAKCLFLRGFWRFVFFNRGLPSEKISFGPALVCNCCTGNVRQGAKNSFASIPDR